MEVRHGLDRGDDGGLPYRDKQIGKPAGEPLDVEIVMEARRLNIEEFEKMQVSRTVPIQEARDGGLHILGARWMDIETEDGAHRSQVVAK